MVYGAGLHARTTAAARCARGVAVGGRWRPLRFDDMTTTKEASSHQLIMRAVRCRWRECAAVLSIVCAASLLYIHMRPRGEIRLGENAFMM